MGKSAYDFSCQDGRFNITRFKVIIGHFFVCMRADAVSLLAIRRLFFLLTTGFFSSTTLPPANPSRHSQAVLSR
jgi:hypothetical protein